VVSGRINPLKKTVIQGGLPLPHEYVPCAGKELRPNCRQHHWLGQLHWAVGTHREQERRRRGRACQGKHFAQILHHMLSRKRGALVTGVVLCHHTSLAGLMNMFVQFLRELHWTGMCCGSLNIREDASASSPGPYTCKNVRSSLLPIAIGVFLQRICTGPPPLFDHPPLPALIEAFGIQCLTLRSALPIMTPWQWGIAVPGLIVASHRY